MFLPNLLVAGARVGLIGKEAITWVTVQSGMVPQREADGVGRGSDGPAFCRAVLLAEASRSQRMETHPAADPYHLGPPAPSVGVATGFDAIAAAEPRSFTWSARCSSADNAAAWHMQANQRTRYIGPEASPEVAEAA